MSLQLCRFIVGGAWIYQGFLPKLLHIAPLEQKMTASLGFSPDIANYITQSAGVGEILFGILLIVFYKQNKLVLLNIMALFGLLLFTFIFVPSVLIEAFNPVTTNIPLIALSVIWLQLLKESQLGK